MGLNVNNTRALIGNIISNVYKNILRVNASSNTINSWINRLSIRNTTLYYFLVSVISPKISIINTSVLAHGLYLSVLGRNSTISESSKLISIFNEELRKYGSKERALKKMINYFVNLSSVKNYCDKLGINSF